MTQQLHPLAAAYMKRLRVEARRLPRGARTELLADIEGHLAEATSAGMSDAEVLTVLDRLGEPEEIVDAHTGDAQSNPPRRRGLHEWSAIFLLLFGGFVFGIGWIAGLILLWSSSAWRTRDKWLGTLVLPGGLATVALVNLFAFGTSQECVSNLPPGVIKFKGIEVHAHRGQTICTPGPSTAMNILAIACFIATLLLPILTAIHLARQARRTVVVAV